MSYYRNGQPAHSLEAENSCVLVYFKYYSVCENGYTMFAPQKYFGTVDGLSGDMTALKELRAPTELTAESQGY